MNIPQEPVWISKVEFCEDKVNVTFVIPSTGKSDTISVDMNTISELQSGQFSQTAHARVVKIAINEAANEWINTNSNVSTTVSDRFDRFKSTS